MEHNPRIRITMEYERLDRKDDPTPVEKYYVECADTEEGIMTALERICGLLAIDKPRWT